MDDSRLQNLRDAILKTFSETTTGLSIADLEKKVQQQGIPFWPGEVQEVVWRLVASKKLQISTSWIISAQTVQKD
jgi:hypothetical protein